MIIDGKDMRSLSARELEEVILVLRQEYHIRGCRKYEVRCTVCGKPYKHGEISETGAVTQLHPACNHYGCGAVKCS